MEKFVTGPEHSLFMVCWLKDWRDMSLFKGSPNNYAMEYILKGSFLENHIFYHFMSHCTNSECL